MRVDQLGDGALCWCLRLPTMAIVWLGWTLKLDILQGRHPGIEKVTLSKTNAAHRLIHHPRFVQRRLHR